MRLINWKFLQQFRREGRLHASHQSIHKILSLHEEIFCEKINYTLRNYNWFCKYSFMWDLTFSQRWGWWCPSGFWYRVDSSVDANISEKHTVSIFRDEGLTSDVEKIPYFYGTVMILKPIESYNCGFEFSPEYGWTSPFFNILCHTTHHRNPPPPNFGAVPWNIALPMQTNHD
jgi:hypothetical protein